MPKRIVPSRLIDVFTFHDEADLLEIRLQELKDVVDRFVLVEARQTHAGADQEPVWTTRLHGEPRFAAFRDRLDCVVVDEFPYDPDPWIAEHFQRDSGMRALGRVENEALIMVSDVDEIPSAEAVLRAKEGPMPCVMVQDFFYFTPWIRRDIPWVQGTALAYYGQLIGLQALREQPGKRPVHRGGWHFSFFGGPAMIRKKLESFAHVNEFIWTPEMLTDEALLRKIHQREDLFGRRDHHWFPVEGWDHLPRFMRENRDRYEAWQLTPSAGQKEPDAGQTAALGDAQVAEPERVAAPAP